MKGNFKKRLVKTYYSLLQMLKDPAVGSLIVLPPSKINLEIISKLLFSCENADITDEDN